VTVVPANTPAAEALAMAPDGVFLSNGPGDPAAVTYGVKAVRDLLGKAPVFGICLGHQILGLALGGSTYKLRFRHHGGNQPVALQRHRPGRDLQPQPRLRGRPEIAAGRCRDTHVNLNDGCCEGLRARDLRAFSVQYHPRPRQGRTMLVPVWPVYRPNERWYYVPPRHQRHQGREPMDLLVPPSEQEDKIGKAIVNAAYIVHKALGLVSWKTFRGGRGGAGGLLLP